MKRNMSESKAWEFLANAWDNAKPVYEEEKEYGVIINTHGIYRTCLCHCIRELYTYDLISESTNYSMRNKINSLRTNRFSPFKWSFSKSGAKARAKFCRKMAAETKRK
jgi:hypothetical protein